MGECFHRDRWADARIAKGKMLSGPQKYFFLGLLILILSSPAGLNAQSVAAVEAKSGGRPSVDRSGADERFYACLERLLNEHGNDPFSWPDSVDKIVVKAYLHEMFGVEFYQVAFGRNLLGYGLGNSRDMARKDLENGKVDAWGVPYDLILASSSKKEGGVKDALAGWAITQGFETFNKELTRKVYVVLKADFHSQFGEVFTNFNGGAVQIYAREINFLGCPGSALPDYANQIRSPLAVAGCLQASIYICNHDKVPNIPRSMKDLVSLMGRDRNMAGNDKKLILKARKDVPVRIIQLKGCSHTLEGYFAGMRFYGETLLAPRAP